MSNRNNTPGVSDDTNKVTQRNLTIRGISSLGKIKTDATLSSALTKTTGAIKVVIDQDNSNISLINQDSGKRFGAITELEKLNGFRKFATDAKKASVSEGLIEPIRVFLLHAIETGKVKEPNVITQGSLSLLKDFKINFDNLKENLEYTEDTLRRLAPLGLSTDLVDVINTWTGTIVQVLIDVTISVVKGQDTKGLLAEKLFEKGIPKWAFDKLAKATLASTNLTGVDLIFFPRDPRKGIYFTVREITNNGFSGTEINSYLLKNAQYQKKILTDTDIVKQICKTKEEVSFESESDPIGSTLRNEKVFFVNVFLEVDQLLDEKAAKLNLLGTPSMATPKAALHTVLNAGLAFQTGHFKTADHTQDFWSTLFPNVKFDAVYTKKVSPQSVAKAAKVANWLGHNSMFNLDEQLMKSLFEEVLPIMLGITKSNAIAKAIVAKSPEFKRVRTVCRVDPIAEVQDNHGKVIVKAVTAVAEEGPQRPKSSKKKWIDYYAPKEYASKSEIKERESLLEKMKMDKESLQKSYAGSKTAFNSSLTKTGQALCEAFENHDKLDFLAKPVKDWLCGFSTREIQAVAAEFVRAQFTEINVFDDDEFGSDDGGTNEDDDGL